MILNLSISPISKLISYLFPFISMRFVELKKPILFLIIPRTIINFFVQVVGPSTSTKYYLYRHCFPDRQA